MSDWKSDGNWSGPSDGGFKDMAGGTDQTISQFGGDGATDVTYRSWFDRIKSALVGVLVGIVLIPGSSWLLFWNEGRAVTTARSLTEGAGLVLSVPADRADAANEGRLVYVTDAVRAPGTLTDPTFGFVRVQDALRLIRTVEMYQWRENRRSETRNRVGGGQETVTTYSYEQVWSSTLNNSGNFRQAGHNNPPGMAHRSNTLVAQNATLGAFRLTPDQLNGFGHPQPVALDANNQAVRNNNATVRENVLYLGASPDQPRIGDLRITFTHVPAGAASIIGQQTGQGLSSFQTRAGDRIFMMEAGTVPSQQMFQHAEEGNRILTWILRAVGLLVMAIGFAMIMAPLGVLADVVPIFGDIVRFGTGLIGLALTFVLGPLVMAVAWFWYRPVVAAIVMAVGIAIAFGIAMLARGRAARRAAAQGFRPPMPPPQQPMQGWGR